MRALVLASLAAVVLALPVAAHAQTDPDTTPVLAIGVPLGFAGGFALGLGIADFVSYAMDSPWDDGWAVVDLVFGSTLAIAGGVLFGMGLDGPLDEDLLGVGIYAFAWGAHLLGHGIWSLLNNDREPPPIELEIAPTDGGARFAFTGTI